MSLCVSIPNNEERCNVIRQRLVNPLFMNSKHPCYSEFHYSKAALTSLFLTIFFGSLIVERYCGSGPSKAKWSQLTFSEKSILVAKRVILFVTTVFFIINIVLACKTENDYKKCLASVQIACC